MILSSRWILISAAAFLCLAIGDSQASASINIDTLAKPLCPASQSLPSLQSLIPVRIKQVIDGDTVKLFDGRSIRIIGLNTPEMNWGKGRAPQPYAKRAWLSLRDLIRSSKRIYLSLGIEQKDRYGRTLAHLYGENSSGVRFNLAAQVIHQGLGFYIAIPPNLSQSLCFKQVEKQARIAGRGLWESYAAQLIGKKVRLETGFQRLSARVDKALSGKNGWLLSLDGPIVMRINRNDLQNFDINQLRVLTGKRITVRGWLIDRGEKTQNHQKGYKRWMLNVSHPLSIEAE